ncbi:MAG: pilus assembly protein N-terminal domain-containing protein [Pseudomonadota bacterium]
MRFTSTVVLSALLVISTALSASAQQINVEANKSLAVRISKGDAASVVIGNPNIADVSVHDENLLFITGRTFGTTNLLVFNNAGEQLYSGDVVVTTNTSSLVTIRRAGENFSFDCTPECRSVLVIGDEAVYFDRNFDQTEDLQELSQAD